MVVIELEGIPSVENAAKILLKAADQIPFATALALTRTAEAVRDYETENIQARFTIRRPWWRPGTKYGVNVKAARKNNLEARTFTRAPWLKLQEYGGTKTSPKNDSVTIPERSLRQSTDRLTPRRVQPGKVLANMQRFRAFRIGLDIFQRFGKGSRDIRLLFTGKTQTRIPQRLGFRTGGVDHAQKVYQKEFGKALAFALATANKP